MKKILRAIDRRLFLGPILILWTTFFLFAQDTAKEEVPVKDELALMTLYNFELRIRLLNSELQSDFQTEVEALRQRWESQPKIRQKKTEIEALTSEGKAVADKVFKDAGVPISEYEIDYDKKLLRKRKAVEQ